MQRVKGNGGCMRKTMCGGLFVSAATQVLMHKRCLSAPGKLPPPYKHHHQKFQSSA